MKRRYACMPLSRATIEALARDYDIPYQILIYRMRMGWSWKRLTQKTYDLPAPGNRDNITTD